MKTAEQVAIDWYKRRCASEQRAHERRTRLARRVTGAEVSTPTKEDKPQQDPTQIPPIVNHAVQPPKDEELNQIPAAKAESWMHNWFVKAPVYVGMSFLKAYSNFLMSTADGPIQIAKLTKKLIKPKEGEARWTPADTQSDDGSG